MFVSNQYFYLLEITLKLCRSLTQSTASFCFDHFARTRILNEDMLSENLIKSKKVWHVQSPSGYLN